MIQVFISYSRKNVDFADQLEADLRRRDFLVWIDRNSIHGGELWKQAIIQGITNSVVVIVLVSHIALESQAVLDEIKIALANSKTLIPLVIDKLENFAVDLKKIGLDDNQAIDFVFLGYERAYSELVKALDYWTFPQKLREGLSHYNRRVRLKTIESLGRYRVAFGNLLVLNTLVDALFGESDQYLARQMTTFIGRFNHVLAVEILIQSFLITKENLKNTRPPPSSDFIFLASILSQLAVIGIGDERVKTLLNTSLNDSNVTIRDTAIEAMESFENRSNLLSLSAFIQLLNDSNGNTRAFAANALGMLGDKRAIEYLRPLLLDEQDAVRSNIQNALDMLDSEIGN